MYLSDYLASLVYVYCISVHLLDLSLCLHVSPSQQDFLSVCLPACWIKCLIVCLSACLMCLFVYLSLCKTIFLFFFISTIHLNIFMSIRKYVCQSRLMYAYMYVSMYVYIYAWMYVCVCILFLFSVDCLIQFFGCMDVCVHLSAKGWHVLTKHLTVCLFACLS